MEISEQLNQLSELQAQRELAGKAKQVLLDNVLALTNEQKENIRDIEDEFALPLAGLDMKILDLTKKIKDAVLVSGATEFGTSLMAVWSKGQTKWETKILEKLVQTYPSIQQARKDGDPSVAIKIVKEKEQHG